MKQQATNTPQTAVTVLENLLKKARDAHQPGDITIVQKQVTTPQGNCRVAVVISRYGLHLELGSREYVNDSVAWPFQEQDLAQTVVLLNDYLGEDE
jgi:hypothetical protein